MKSRLSNTMVFFFTESCARNEPSGDDYRSVPRWQEHHLGYHEAVQGSCCLQPFVCL